MMEQKKIPIFVPSEKSHRFFKEAKKCIVGGVNSPIRAFKNVSTIPIYIKKGLGSKIYDLENKEYIDYVNAWGASILGHADTKVLAGLKSFIDNGFGFGALSEIEIKIAQLIKKSFPSVDLLRMVNSGTEATMSAIRLARAYTKRSKIIQFEGSYHGYYDSFMIKKGKHLKDRQSKSPGILNEIIEHTLLAEYNDIESVKECFVENKNQIAAVIIEAVSGNMGCIPAHPSFIKALFELTRNENCLLIFDEVITGFRIALGGAQEYYNVKADITCFGKIIGGGLPIGAYGGLESIMKHIAPEGEVYQGGTFAGNITVLMAGYLTLKELNEKSYKNLESMGLLLEEGMRENMRNLKQNWVLNRIGSMFTLFFSEKPISCYSDLKFLNLKLYTQYFRSMLARYVYTAASQYEANFLTLQHSKADIEKTVKIQYEALKELFE